MIGNVPGVEALVPGVGPLEDGSTPDSDQVETWLTEATVMVTGAMADAGYSTTVAVDAAIYPALTAMTQLYAAANVLQARGLDTLSGGEENRSEQMFKRFYTWLAWLAGANLTELGATLLVITTARRRIQTRQTRRIDAYSATYEGSALEYQAASE